MGKHFISPERIASYIYWHDVSEEAALICLTAIANDWKDVGYMSWYPTPPVLAGRDPKDGTMKPLPV